MASNEESSRRGHTYGPNKVFDSILHQGDNVYLSNEKPKIDCREAFLLKDPLIYRESLKNDKGERASGTCEWIIENEIYRSWLNGDEHRLWICGGPGKGKTMLSIFLTEELERKQREGGDDQDTTLLYFFCTNGNENFNNAIAVLRGLAYQLLSKHPDISTSVSPYFETEKHTENTLSSPETLWMVFKTLLRAPSVGTVYCILDGLDECDAKSIGKLVKQFRDFYSSSNHTGPIAQNLKLAIVSRKINGLEDFPQIRLDPDNNDLISDDIKRFISTAMQELSRRSGYDDYFLRDIESTLLRRSQGTFLWIGFVMKELLDMSTRMEIMDVLNALPQGLPAMYGRMLWQIKSSQRHIISTILTCVTMARRPMTLEELKTAVSLLCNTPIDSTSIMRDRIASCGPILQISPEAQDTCSLVHQSARDYLLREEVDNDPILEEFRIKVKEAHASLARICLACIENSDFRHKPLDITEASVLKKSPLLGYATEYWPEHARHADEDLDFSKTSFQDKDDVWKHWWQAYEISLGLDYDVSEGFRPLHMASYLGLNSLVRRILQANAGRISLKFRKYVDQRNEYGRTPLMLAADEGHHSVVQLLLANGADVNMRSKYTHWGCRRTALEAAATRGHLSVVQLLLVNGTDPKLPGNDWALPRAIQNGHTAVVQLLLTKGADVNKKFSISSSTVRYDTALRLAVHIGHEDLVRLLLANGANVNTKNGSGDTGLHEATSNGNEALVRLLLANGADVNMKRSCNNNAPLHEAACNGHEALVRLLIANGAEVNSKGSHGRTALHEAAGIGSEAALRLFYLYGADEFYKALAAAAGDGHEAIVRLLLTNGADVNITDSNGQTALRDAAIMNHEAVVRLLLTNGADVKNGCKALYQAATHGNEAMIQLLLVNGADVNITGFFDNSTPLHQAAQHGHEAAVSLLLANGSNVNTKDKDNQTALYQAAGNGHEAVVRLLLANGSDINTKDKDDHTALNQAAGKGHEATVRLLLLSGADVTIKDKYGRTALYEAALRGQQAIVQLLLENSTDNKGDAFNEALAAAAWGGQETIVRLLLANSAHADIKDSTAIIRAVEERHEHILGMLLENGADVNGRHLHYGIWYTALEMAAKRGHTTTVQFLLANGAWNVGTKDTEEPSRTALDWAVLKGYKDIVQLLLAKGVNHADLMKALGWAVWGRHKGVIIQILEFAGKSS